MKRQNEAAAQQSTAMATLTVARMSSCIADSGTELQVVGAAGGAVTVTVSGNVTVVGTGVFVVQDNQVLTDNGAFTDGTSKLFMAGYIFDEAAGTALTENDAAAARVDSKRATIGVIEDETTRGRRLTITAGNAAKVDGSAVTQPVSGTVTATPSTSGTATLTNVTDSATSVTLLASNASRKGASLYNDSTANCYVKFGTTASTTSFTVLMRAGAYYEVPFQHTGKIDGIWATAPGGAMRVTEFT